MDNRAQLHTLEGLGAAFLITMTVLTITQSSIIVSPQNEMAVNVQLEQMSYDALMVLDIAGYGSVQCNLTECVASWDMTEATYPANELEELNEALSYLLPDVMYNVDLAYFKGDKLQVEQIVINGQPGDNAVSVKHYVTLTNHSVRSAGGGWNLAEDEIKVVEVRLTAWKV